MIQQKEMKLENIELPVLHSEKDIPEDVLSTFETYCIKDGVSYAMNETKDELYAINSSLSDHDINTLLKSAINKHEFDAGDQVYLYADDDELHYHLEELFDQYLDAPDDFDFVSEEFESGLEQYDKIQKLLDDVLQFEKDVDSHYVQQFDPHYAVSIGTEHDMLEKRTVKEQQSGEHNVYSNVNPKNIIKTHNKQEKDDKEK